MTLAATVTVQVDFATDPGSGDPPSWTTISTGSTRYVTAWSTSRGRSYELDRIEAGTLQAVLNNIDGRFDPTNTGSPYSPGVLPMRRIRVYATVSGTDYPLFWGFVERWPMAWEAGVVGRTNLTAVDGFAVLAQRTLRSALAHEQFAGYPAWVFPLDEAQGSTTAGSIAEGNSIVAPQSPPAATVIRSKYGAGAVAFGEEAITFDGAGAVRISGGDGSTTASAGSALQLSTPTNSGAFTFTVDGFSVEVWFKAGNVGASQQWSLYAQSAGPSVLPVLSLRIIDTGEVEFLLRDDSGSSVASCTTAAGQDDGEIHQVVASLSADNTTASLHLDGALVDTDTVSGTPFSYEKGFTQVGGVKTATGSNHQFAGDLTVAHVAIYRDIPLDDAAVADHYEAGTTGFSGERTDQRLSRILGYAVWLDGDDLDVGNSTMSGAVLAGRPALEVVQEVAEAESSTVYINADGEVAFRNRHSRYDATVTATFADPASGSDLPYSNDSTFDFDLTHVYSQVRVEPPGVGVVVREDATSRDRYLFRTLTEEPRIDDPNEAADRAEYRLARLKDPHLRMPSLTVYPQRLAAIWPVALGADFGDRVTVERDPPAAPAISVDCFIEAIDHDVTPEAWKTTFALSPADVETYWKLEDPVYGEIDNPDILIRY